MNKLVIKNAIANLVRGASFALVSVLLPFFLARFMASDEYSLWVLVLQIASYVGLLDLGVQTAVVRFVAHERAIHEDTSRVDADIGDGPRARSVLRVALVWLATMGGIGVAVISAIAMLLPKVFPKVPAPRIAEGRLALVVLAASLAVSLPGSVFAAWFVGRQRNAVPALLTALPRAIAVLLAVLAARNGAGLVAMAALIGAGNALTSVLLAVAFRRAGGRVATRNERIAGTARTLFAFSWVLTVWTVAMLIVQGLDTTLVGWFDFKRVGAYGFAAGVVTLISGVMANLFTVLVAPAAQLAAAKDRVALQHLVLAATRWGSMLLGFAATAVFLAAGVVGGLLPATYGPDVTWILRALVVAQAIRLSALPMSTIIVGTADHRVAMMGVVSEATVNLTVSVALGHAIGAHGVAIGTVAGSVVGLGFAIFVTINRTRAFRVSSAEFVRTGLLRPALAVGPLLLAAISMPGFDGPLRVAILSLGSIASVATMLMVGLDPIERRRLRLFAAQLGRSASHA